MERRAAAAVPCAPKKPPKKAAAPRSMLPPSPTALVEHGTLLTLGGGERGHGHGALPDP